MSWDVFPYESYHYSMTTLCTYLSVITTVEGEREGDIAAIKFIYCSNKKHG
jgi:hypothetical protein